MNDLSEGLPEGFKIAGNTRIRLRDTRLLIVQQYEAIQKLMNDPAAKYTFEQKQFFITELNDLIKQMAMLQKLASGRGRYKPKTKGGKKGRPRREYGSDGVPLYQDSPKPVKPDDESKTKFLQEMET